MKFFYSPKQLIELIKNSKKYASSKKEIMTREWFLSENGERAYNEANTPTKRLRLFFDYFKGVEREVLKRIKSQAQGKEAFKELMGGGKTSAAFKMAYLHAFGIEETDFYFSSYPAIFDVSKNPFANYYLQNGRFSAPELLAILKNDSARSFTDGTNRPYLNLTYCQNGQASEMYKLERLIITIAEMDNDENLVAPFIHQFDMEIK